MNDMSVQEMSPARHVLHDLGFFGHYLHTKAGGRSGQQHILVKLYQSGGHMTQRELQELSNISSAALSEVLAKLEGTGGIERTRSDEDRRQLDIALTDEGWRRAARFVEQREGFEEHCLSCLSADEQTQLIGLLDRLADHWQDLRWEEAEGEGACA